MFLLSLSQTSVGFRELPEAYMIPGKLFLNQVCVGLWLAHARFPEIMDMDIGIFVCPCVHPQGHK